MADPSAFLNSLMQLLAGSGPQGYNNDIRQNLGMNTPQGGAFQTSGMTNTRPNGIVPNKVRPDAVVPPLKAVPVKPTSTPLTPTTTPTPIDPTAMPGYTLIGGTWWPNSLLERRPNMQQPGGVNSR